MQAGRPSTAFAAFAACVVACVGCVTACGSSGETSDPQPQGVDAGAPLPADDGSAPALDAGPDARDASSDVVPPGDRFCTKLTPVPRFCDDFDDGDLTNDWTQFVAPAGSVFELDPSSSTSAPASFHVVAKATAAAAANNVLLRSTMLGVVKHAKLAFDVFLPSVTFTKGTFAIAQFYANLDDAYTLYLRGPDDAGNVALLEAYVGGVTTRHTLTKLPPVATWTRVTIDLDLVGGNASVWYGAYKALDAAPYSALTGTEATVRIGAIVDGPADAFEARFDDVVIDY
jgi:hypothetical protein